MTGHLELPPYGTPNLYGGSVWGVIAEHRGTYTHMKHYMNSVTSSAFAPSPAAPKYKISLPGLP